MKLRHVVPFMLLFAWQAAPSPDPDQRPSRWRLWFGRGASSIDFAYWGPGSCQSCDCSPVPQRYVEQQRSDLAGVQADAWPSARTRISAAVGSASGAGTGRTFAAGLVAWETPALGFGAGWSGAPDFTAYRGPSAYLRVGSLDGAQLRAELRTPTSTPAATGWARAGLAFNQRGGQMRFSIFLGISAVEVAPATTYPSYPGPIADKVTRPAFFADASVPLGPQLDLFARGHVAARTRGIGLGASVRFGR